MQKYVSPFGIWRHHAQPESKLQSLAEDEENTAKDRFKAAGAALLYAVVATSMNFVNKATIQYFPLPMTILALQMIATVLILMPLKFLGMIQFGAFSWDKTLRLMPITALYTANTAFALVGLKTLNIPMYSTLKRLTPVIVLITKAVIKGENPEWTIWSSVLLVMGGCVCASLGDFSFNISGYGCALLSCFLQASYLLLVEHTGSQRDVGTAELLAYSASLSAPGLILMAFITGEMAVLYDTTVIGISMLGALPLVCLVVLCSLCGCLLNYTLFLCTVCNSALLTTMVGVLKGVIVTVLGFFVLGGVKFHWINVAGVALNMIGGVWYTYIHYAKRYQGATRRNPVTFPASSSMVELGQFTPRRTPSMLDFSRIMGRRS